MTDKDTQTYSCQSIVMQCKECSYNNILFRFCQYARRQKIDIRRIHRTEQTEKISPLYSNRLTKTVKKASQSFFARRQKIVLIVFSGGMYVGKNTESDGKRIRAGFFGRLYARSALLPLTIQTRIACGQCLARTKIRSGKTALHISVRNVRDISCAEDAGLLTQAKDDKPERA